jgi:hypothetical protein
MLFTGNILNNKKQILFYYNSEGLQLLQDQLCVSSM